MSPAPPEPPRVPAVLQPLEGEPLVDDAAWTEVEISGGLVGETADVVDVEVAASRLVGCDLTGATVERLRMTDVLLDGCDLSGATLYGADLTRVVFESCRMSGTVLAGGRLSDVAFNRCKADGLNLRMVQGTRVTFDDTVLRGAELLQASIAEARLLGCDLTEVDVTRATLTGAWLHRSTLEAMKGVEHLRDVVIEATQLVPLAVQVFAANGIVIAEEDGDDT